MIHPKSFDALFWKETRHHKTYEDAFNSMNDDYIKATGTPRYKNYEAYRKSRDQRCQEKIIER